MLLQLSSAFDISTCNQLSTEGLGFTRHYYMYVIIPQWLGLPMQNFLALYSTSCPYQLVIVVKVMPTRRSKSFMKTLFLLQIFIEFCAGGAVDDIIIGELSTV